MKYEDGVKRLAEYREKIATIRSEMRDVQNAIEPREVENYAFSTPLGAVRLADLFGDKKDLFMIHNMGSGCPYCTLWADGFNGIYDHLANRAAFVVSSPDEPAAQERFAKTRGWRFRMVSHAGSSFAEDMGYRAEKGGWLPGTSVFRRDGGRPAPGIVRVANTGFGPEDDFCVLWPLLALLPEGADSWSSKFSYAQGRNA